MANEQSQDPILLLQRLAVGATAAIYSVDEWARRLDGVPYASKFVAQLRDEWLPISPVDEVAQAIGEKCRLHMAEWNSGWPNLWAHTLRVAGYALHLAPSLNIPNDQAYLIAVLHDVGKFDELRDGTAHEEIAAEFAREWLPDHYPEEVVDDIATTVAKEGAASEPLVRLLYDSDKLEKIGASGIVRRVSQVLTLPNILDSLRRIESDLRRFPTLKLERARAIAARKREFTETFIQAVEASVGAISG